MGDNLLSILSNRNSSGIRMEWEKDLNSIFVRSNNVSAQIIGFKNAEEMQGKNDSQMRCRAAEFAEIFQQQDRLVIEHRKPLQFLELISFADDQWRLSIVTKIPQIRMGHLLGTQGSAIDVTAILPKLSSLFTISNTRFKRASQRQQSYFFDCDIYEINLSERQSECLFFLLRGKNVKEISQFLNLSPRTIEDYVNQLKLKFNCSSKGELIEKAIDHGYIYMIPTGIINEQFSVML